MAQTEADSRLTGTQLLQRTGTGLFKMGAGILFNRRHRLGAGFFTLRRHHSLRHEPRGGTAHDVGHGNVAGIFGLGKIGDGLRSFELALLQNFGIDEKCTRVAQNRSPIGRRRLNGFGLVLKICKKLFLFLEAVEVVGR